MVVLQLLLWAQVGPKVPLPEDIFRIAQAQITEKAIYILERSGGGELWKLNRSGKVLARQNNVGKGPGSLQNAQSFALNNHFLYVCDPLKRTVVVFDSDLRFLKEVKVQGLCRSLLFDQEFIYLWMFDPASYTTLQKLNHQWQPVSQFGTPLGNEKQSKGSYFGRQSGTIINTEKSMIVIHALKYQFEIYDSLNNRLIKTVSLPGFDDHFYGSDQFLKQAFYHQAELWILLVDTTIRKSSYYIYNLLEGSFKFVHPTRQVFPDPKGGFVFVEKDADNEPQNLVWVNHPSEASALNR